MENVIKYHAISKKFVDGKMLVTEEIHGTNIAVGIINGSLIFQSRKTLIDRKSKQFGLNEISERLASKITLLHDILKNDFLVYGEIFGKIIPIMKYYDAESKELLGSDSVFFRAIDIYLVDKKVFMKYSDAIECFRRIEIPYVPLLDVEYETLTDLKSLAENLKSNYSEYPVDGLVLKEDEEQSMESRCIFKLKNNYCDGKAFVLNAYTLRNYVNHYRFEAAHSKVGNDFQMIKTEMIRDTMNDINQTLYEKVKSMVEKYLKLNEGRLRQLVGIHPETPDEIKSTVEKRENLVDKYLKLNEGQLHKLVENPPVAPVEIKMTVDDKLESE